MLCNYMKFVVYFFYITNFFVFVNSFTQIYSPLTNKHILYNKPIEKSIFPNNPIYPSKIESIQKLIRVDNTLPTLLLCFSGGWISNPSFYSLLSTKTFIVSTLNTIGVMFTSMIVNDIFDLELDKYNNPNRPLVTGEIKVKEAISYSFFMLFVIELSSLLFLPLKIQNYLHLALLNILLYTPYLKKMTLLKNISCAWLVSFSIYFAGLSATAGQMLPNIHLLTIASRLIFFGSLMNELLLDIRDRDGDEYHNIITVPVKYGNEKTWWLVFAVLATNVGWNSIEIVKYYGFAKSLLFSLLCSPFFINLYKIKKQHYSKPTIYYFLKETSKYLFFILIYLCSFVKK